MNKLLRLGHLGALILSLAAGIAASPSAHASDEIPQNCKADCVTAYGEPLGTAPDGQVAYSNCKSNCVVFEPNFLAKTFTGIKWQCVEYARRWLLSNRGMVYGDVDTASDIWGKISSYTVVADGHTVPTENFENGSTESPRVGDLLIYGKDLLGTGHVAVITDLDAAKGIIKVAEQNYKNVKWPGNFARTIELINRDGRFWVLDPYLLGWKRAKS